MDRGVVGEGEEAFLAILERDGGDPGGSARLATGQTTQLATSETAQLIRLASSTHSSRQPFRNRGEE
jgi:hypothetical protein